MIGYRALALICACLLHVLGTNGFSIVQPLSYRRSKNVNLSFSSYELSSMRAPVTDRGISVERSLSNLMATKEDGEGTDEEAVDNKIAGRKKRLKIGYQVASMSYVATCLLCLLWWGSLSASAFYYAVGGGPLNMAVILYILKGAAVHDRLGSDTYKRLNITVMAYALIQLLIPTKALGWPASASLKIPGFLALVNGLKGYGYGCLGWDKSKDSSVVLTDIKGGVQSTLKGLVTVKAKSLGYMLATLMFGSMSCLKLKELCTMSFSTADTVLRLSKLARFGMMATIMYTLKDACDRGRLSGTTFVQLNLMAATAFLSISLYLLPTYGSLLANTQILIAVGLFAMTLFNGLSNRKA